MNEHPTTPIITLTTDFGLKDSYVASLKGVILGIHPHARIVDITHLISPHNIVEAAFTLMCTYPYFPEGTIHVAVIDPGVGSHRKAICVTGDNRIFLGPDNGVLWLCSQRLSNFSTYQIDNHALFTASPSYTFHGRDIFAPVAAHLALGMRAQELGGPVARIQSLNLPQPIVNNDAIEGTVLHIDSFGNILTNIHRSHLAHFDTDQRQYIIHIGQITFTGISQTYAEQRMGETFALFSSSDFLEIATRERSVAALLGAHIGQAVVLKRSIRNG
ncbi:MAG: SAM-dependent chlorinase/fluorinase [Candidatus Omnitrophica bacterium]|nr:SAM-dependent chlorinase/fluorinase [Candidatus Omnitrophota bacterium]